MPDPVTKETSVGKVEKETESTTHSKTTTTVKKINVSILEMEDVLFHHNSAVMMPESPIEEPDEDKGTEKQEKVTGAKAMALIFKLYNFDPDKKLLIAGHTDTSGDDKYNFELSELRAKNVQYILSAERDLWAEISYSKQKIEDYQQVLNYVNQTHKYPCNSGKVDNVWGSITRGAIENFINYFNGEFITRYSKDFMGPMALTRIPGGQLELVKRDSKKRWTEELWKAAYNFYFLAIASALEIKPSVLYEKARTVVKWADNKNKYVACGESFPIDEARKDEYRSQDNRRVEILIFDGSDSPVIKCPVTDKGKPKWDTKHKPEECPLWHNLILRPLYLDPKDLNSITYHIAFTYWNKVKEKLMRVPEGLPVEAYQDGKKVESIIGYNQSEKLYCVKVRYKKPIKDLAGIKLHFEFKTKDKWIYTKNKDSDPILFPKKPEDLKELKKKDAYKDVAKVEDLRKLQFPGGLNFYDLPAEWSSVNYWTRYESSGGKKTGERFQKVIADADKLHLKPIGNKLTQPKKPMTFSLDDIVLATGNRSQVIRDRKKDNSLFPVGSPLDDKSRYTLFYIDCTTKENVAGTQKNMRRLKIYNTKAQPDQPCFTDVPFKENLITDVPGHARIIYFCNNFYDVHNKRSLSTDPGFSLNKGHVSGARMALYQDADVHGSHAAVCTNAADRANTYVTGGIGIGDCGNYEMHYFHNCAELDGKALGYLIIYWCCRLRISPNTDVFGDAVTPGIADDVNDHRKFGMKNAMDRLNKDYMIEKKSGTHDILIRPFHFMEAKNDTNGGAHKTMTSIVRGYPGASAWMSRLHAQFRSGVKSDGSRYGDWEADPAYFSDYATFPDSDGSTYAALTNHHEMGHATGNLDDYLYATNFPAGTSWSRMPAFVQQNTAPGGPYSFDNCGRMNRNASPRLREYWKFVCWLHDASQAGNEPHKVLNKYFSGTKFRITYKVYKPPKDFTHKFDLADTFKNISSPHHEGLNQAMSGNANVDLLLYKLGDDETSRIIKDGHNFKGILTVRIKLGVLFDPWEPDPKWIFNTAHDWARALDGRFKSMINKKFYLALPNDKIEADNYSNWDKIYVSFVPHFAVSHKLPAGGAPAIPANCHIGIRTKRINGNSFAHAGSTITCNSGWQASEEEIHKRIIRYCFGFDTGANNLTKNNFPKIVQWINGLNIGGGANFSMKDL